MTSQVLPQFQVCRPCLGSRHLPLEMSAEALGEGGKVLPPRHLASSAILALLSWNNITRCLW